MKKITVLGMIVVASALHFASVGFAEPSFGRYVGD
jgi:hypothetical protein